MLNVARKGQIVTQGNTIIIVQNSAKRAQLEACKLNNHSFSSHYDYNDSKCPPHFPYKRYDYKECVTILLLATQHKYVYKYIHTNRQSIAFNEYHVFPKELPMRIISTLN
jgi:hypothetical protein